MSTTSRSSRVDRLGSPLPRHLDQRRNVIIRDTTIEADVRLDCRSAQMPVEDRLCRLKLDALIRALQQLTQALDRARDSSRSVALITSGTPGLPPGLALAPGSQ